ncbi:ABC transporter ATP-binding protein, partial [candidate division KSB1 bacterium]|nr:ABC transporter ATP-binding protein [candidate division KSB1 bacterium]
MTREISEDEVLGKAFDRRLMKRLLTFLRPYRLQVTLAVSLLLFSAAAQLAGPYLVKIAIDRHINSGDLTGLYQIAWFYLAILVFGFGLAFAQTLLTQWIGQK